MFKLRPKESVMKEASHHNEIEKLLLEGRELSTADFMNVCQGMPVASVYSRIRSLVVAGRITRSGRGLYVPVPKPVPESIITPWMKEVNWVLVEECVGINHCITQRDGNLYIEGYKSDLPAIEECLKRHFVKVLNKKEAERFPLKHRAWKHIC